MTSQELQAPIQSIQTRFFRSLRNVGRIFEQFYKAYYSLPRPFLAQSKDGTQETRTFTGTDYAEVAFGLKIDVGPSSTFSESLIMATLDKLYDKQAITLAQYAKYSPTNVFPAGLKQDIANTPPPPSIPPQQSQLQAGGM